MRLECIAIMVAAALLGSAPAHSGEPIFLEQNFGKFRERFYTTPQGSLVVPYDLFISLERPGADQILFAVGWTVSVTCRAR